MWSFWRKSPTAGGRRVSDDLCEKKWVALTLAAGRKDLRPVQINLQIGQVFLLVLKLAEIILGFQERLIWSATYRPLEIAILLTLRMAKRAWQCG
jgi:hypothetical protein